MNNTVLRTVAFGESKTGLATVGYTLKNDLGVTIQARTTTGVSEIGSTGTYFAKVSLDTAFDTIIDWDTGEGTPRHVIGTILAQEAEVAEATSRIRLIWNTLQNQSEIFAKILDSMRIMRGDKKEPQGPDVFAQLGQKLDRLLSRQAVSLSDIESILAVKMSLLQREMPKVHVPDHRRDFVQITGLLTQINANLDKVPKTETDYKNELKRLKDSLQVTIDKLPVELKPLLGGVMVEVKRSLMRTEKAYQDIGSVRADLDALIKQLAAHEKGMAKINENLEDTINAVKPTKLLLDCYNMMAEGKNPGAKNIRMALGIKN